MKLARFNEMGLSAYIAEQICRYGPVSFHDFMEWCLYEPNLGYYTNKCKGIGFEGDFYTSATLSPVFGAVLGKQLEEMWELMGKHPFSIVEYGAGTGHLCKAILTYLERNKEMYADLRYCIIEKSKLMRDKARDQLPELVEWFDSITKIPELYGCVLSNELVDNFAVHRVVNNDELMEVYVDYQNGFAEQLRPAGLELNAYLSELGIKLPRSYVTEINLDALAWISEIASTLKKGYVITIDYGFENAELYKEGRSQGTLLCYYKHSVNDSFYDHIGEQDMTSHVNFSALNYWGSKKGLRETGFTSQGYFLSSLDFREQLLNILAKEQDVVTAAKKAVMLSHTLLMDMGNKYKVLIQEKGVKPNRLKGFILNKDSCSVI